LGADVAGITFDASHGTMVKLTKSEASTA